MGYFSPHRLAFRTVAEYAMSKIRMNVARVVSSWLTLSFFFLHPSVIISLRLFIPCYLSLSMSAHPISFASVRLRFPLFLIFLRPLFT